MSDLLADKVSCPRTQHYDSGDSQISNPLIPSLTLYEQLSHCASYVHYLCKYDVVVGRAPFFSLDETQEQHIGHCEIDRRMLGRAFALFSASFLTEAYFIYTCFLTEAYFVYTCICELRII